MLYYHLYLSSVLEINYEVLGDKLHVLISATDPITTTTVTTITSTTTTLININLINFLVCVEAISFTTFNSTNTTITTIKRKLDLLEADALG